MLSRQLVVAVALLAGAVIDLAAGVGWALALTVAAATVLTALTAAVAVSELTIRDRALEMIADGHETLPITAIQRARHRLTDPRTQRRLAHAIDTATQHALRQPRPGTRAAQPLYQRRVIATVTEELDALAQLLRTGRASVRGVALAEQLLANGASPFYGESPERLREQLDRIQRASAPST